jgi:threonine/homoserine/homoserine lactone efflux protein
MTLEIILTFAAYAFVTSITPGPNNTMLLASGVNHGFVRTIPHILGVSLGFGVMVFAVGSGLGSLFLAFPVLHTVLRWAGAAYLLWLAWKIANSGAMDGETATAKPLTFLEAAVFQWVNPKCWLMATGAITTYMPQSGRFADLVVITVLFCLINGPCVGSWAGFGVLLRRWLTEARANRIFNIAMAVLLVLSLQPLLSEGIG